MDHAQEPFASTSKSVEPVPPRLRLTRNNRNTHLLTEDAPPCSSSSSSSSTASRKNTTAAFSQLARASSSADSPAARLRALTNRVMNTSTSSRTTLPHEENGSDAETDRPAHSHSRAPALSGELESDVESMVEHSFTPPTNPQTAKQKFRDLYMRTLTASEPGPSVNLTPPRPRRASLTSTAVPPAHKIASARRLSTSDEETDRVHTTRSRDDTAARRIKTQHQSINVLRSMLESSGTDIESLEDTPARERTIHPLRVELAAANLSHELPNPTPQRPSMHSSFSKHPPLRTSTPNNERTRGRDDEFLPSDQSSMIITPLHPFSSNILHRDSSSYPPHPPNPRSRTPSPIPPLHPTHKLLNSVSTPISRHSSSSDTSRLASLTHESSRRTSRPGWSRHLNPPISRSDYDGAMDRNSEVHEISSRAASDSYSQIDDRPSSRQGARAVNGTPKESSSYAYDASQKPETPALWNLSSSFQRPNPESVSNGSFPSLVPKYGGREVGSENEEYHRQPRSRLLDETSNSGPLTQSQRGRNGRHRSPFSSNSNHRPMTPPSPASTVPLPDSPSSPLTKSNGSVHAGGQNHEPEFTTKSTDDRTRSAPTSPTPAAPPATTQDFHETEASVSQQSFTMPSRRSPSALTIFQTPPRPYDLPDPPSSPDGSTVTSPVTNRFANGAHSVPHTPHAPGGWNPRTPARSVAPSQRTPAGDEGPASVDVPLNPQTPAAPGTWNRRDQLASQTAPAPATPMPIPSADPESDQIQNQAGSSASSSAPPKTPAPPGAWAVTPGPGSLRKGILKVRFDEMSAAGQSTPDHAAGSEDGEASNRGSPKSRDLRSHKALPHEFNGDTATSVATDSAITKRHSTPSGGQSPAALVKRRRRRLKMVDEFGNELEQHSLPVELVASKEGEKDDTPATAEELRGLRAVSRAIPELARELDEDSISMTLPRPLTSLADQLKNKANVADLKDLSRVARLERAKLQRQLQLVRSGEDALNTKITRLRSTVQASHLASSVPRRWPRWVWAILIAEVFVFWIVLRTTRSRAEYLFLTAHYDPFFPALSGPRPLSPTLGIHEGFSISLSGLDPPSRHWWVSAFVQVLWEVMSSLFTLFFGSNEMEFSLPPSGAWVPC